MEQRTTVVKSTLHCPPRVKDAVEQIIQHVSEIEAVGSCIFTLAILLFHQEHPKNLFAKEFISQTTIKAAFTGTYKPIKTKHVIPCDYLVRAKALLEMNTWPKEPIGLVQTINQCARRYFTVLCTSLHFNFEKRMRQHITLFLKTHEETKNWSKSLRGYVIRYIYNKCCFSTFVLNVELYNDKSGIHRVRDDFLKRHEVLHFIEEHRTLLSEGLSQSKQKVEVAIKRNPHLFLTHALFMGKEVEKLLLGNRGAKLPFQVIPQLKYKVRSLTFGKEQTAELAYYMAKKGLMDGNLVRFSLIPDTTTRKRKRKSFEDVSLAQWRKISHVLSDIFFFPPSKMKKHWNKVVTTDGVSASWHKVSIVKHEKRKRVQKTRVLEQVPDKGWLGHHGTDVLIPGEINIIAVDPGHAHIMDAVFVSRDKVRNIKRTKPSKQKFLSSVNRSEYTLTNKEWQRITGRSSQRMKTDHLHQILKRKTLETSRVFDPGKYLDHTRSKFDAAEQCKHIMSLKAPRRWRFNNYRQEQRAVKKLSTTLLSCFDNQKALLVWGDGSFGPDIERSRIKSNSKTSTSVEPLHARGPERREKHNKKKFMSQGRNEESQRQESKDKNNSQTVSNL